MNDIICEVTGGWDDLKSKDLFHSVSELQRKRVEYDLELRRLESEVHQLDFKFSRLCQKLQLLEATTVETEQDFHDLQEKVVHLKECNQVQDVATAKLQSNLASTIVRDETLKQELTEIQRTLNEKLSTWHLQVMNKLQLLSNFDFASSDKTEDSYI